MRRILRAACLCLAVIALMFTAVSCSGGKSGTDAPVAWRDCLGDYSYDSSVIAMVYEQVEGEEPGMLGVQYREVTDLAHLTSQMQIPVCLYFYSSLRTDTSGITAGMEDLAQELDGKVVIVAIDESAATDIADAYAIEDVPCFILLNQATRISELSAKDGAGQYRTAAEIASWLTSIVG